MKIKPFILPLIAVALWQNAPGASYLIDDFNINTSADYTTYKLLDQGAGTSNVSLVIGGGTASNTSIDTTGAEQAVHLYNTTISLAVGESLIGLSPSITGSGNDLGIAIAASPTGTLGNGSAGDARASNSALFISFRASQQLNCRGYDNGGEVAQAQVLGLGFTPTSLFITHSATNEFEFGYFDGATRTVVSTRTVNDDSAYTRVGFYSDLRSNGAGFNGFDSLNVIPEPSAALLGGLALLGLLRRRR